MRSYSSVEQDLQMAVADFLSRNNPDDILGQFGSTSTDKLSAALLSVAKREDELSSTRKRAVRGLAILEKLDSVAWREILPVASTDLFQEWIPAWGEDDNSTILNEELIRIILEGRRLPKSSTGFGKAVRKFIKRGTDYTSAVFLPGKSYPAWEIKYDCVRSIITLDDKDSMRVLSAFSTMSYWKARDRIIDYINQKFGDRKLSSDEIETAKEILRQIITDRKTEEKTPTMRKARETLRKISGEVE
jgi:hypothetical protein